MNSKTKWVVLILSGLTCALGVAAPSMSLSVLFKEISESLDLTLVQVGIIWGIGALPGIFSSLLGGAISDRLGPRRILIVGSLIVGLAGALRGFSYNFASLLVTMFLLGLVTPLITMSAFKTCGIWFPKEQLGLANGVLSMGMALGFLIGSLVSATVLSPLLGGWRNVLIFYGVLGALISLPWYFTPSTPTGRLTQAAVPSVSMRQAVRHIFPLRNIWLLGLAIIGISGCMQGALGYLPLYLRGQGWTNLTADGALSLFHLVSMTFVVPIALWSDRLGFRKGMVVVMGLMIVTGIGLLSVVEGALVWPVVVLAGSVRDGFMALFMSMIIETEDVGPVYAGTATGFVLMFSGLGNLLAPPIGNSLAEVAPGAPFVFWAALAALGILCLQFTKEKTGRDVWPVKQVSVVTADTNLLEINDD